MGLQLEQNIGRAHSGDRRSGDEVVSVVDRTSLIGHRLFRGRQAVTDACEFGVVEGRESSEEVVAERVIDRPAALTGHLGRFDGQLAIQRIARLA